MGKRKSSFQNFEINILNQFRKLHLKQIDSYSTSIKLLTIFAQIDKTKKQTMILKVAFFVLVVVAGSALSEENRDKWNRFESMVKAMESNALLEDIWDKDHFPKFKEGQSQSVPESQLNCPDFPPSPSAPTSVHALRPSDVSVVAAIGDSLTAANGALAKTPLGLLTEYRGRAFAMGGDKDVSSVVTMPNILRTHANDLHGHSSGSGKQGSNGAKLNYAVPGSTAQDLHGQALKLVDAMRKDSNVDFDKDWKVITVFIGGNDVCDYFDGKTAENTPDNYIQGIKKAIDVFHATVPRVFVNLVEVLDLSILPDLSKGLICPLLHRFLCKNVASGKDNAAVKLLIQEYNHQIFKLVASGKYETRDDFTVVIQPFFRNTTYPRQSNGKPDWSFFAPDCFHFSAKGHASAGEALWNNMMQPVGEKSTSWSPNARHVICPTEANPFLATYQNSHGGFAAFAALPGRTEPSSQNYLFYGLYGFIAICVTLGLVAVAIVTKNKKNRRLGDSLANIPQEVGDENKSATRLNVPLAVTNELYEVVHEIKEQQ